MSVVICPDKPRQLMADFCKAIDQKKIRTWRYVDANGVRWYTHSADQWDAKAWFKAQPGDGSVVFNIAPPPKQNIPDEVYAIFHGRLVEALVSHFGKQVGLVVTTPLPQKGDHVSAA